MRFTRMLHTFILYILIVALRRFIFTALEVLLALPNIKVIFSEIGSYNVKLKIVSD
jgi:hypothetical protein